MALVGDALSHVALPGIALSLLYGVDPFYGVVIFQVTAAFLIFWIEGRSDIPPDATVGLLFTASLAVGILMIPSDEIIESLFGAFPVLRLPFLLGFLGAAAVLALFCFLLAKRFLFLIVSPDLANVNGVGRGHELALFVIFGMIVALGIKLVGTLLMGALTIIPASIARNVTRGMREYVIVSSLLGGAISVAGVWIAWTFRFLPGPSIILLGVAIFLVSIALRRKGQ